MSGVLREILDEDCAAGWLGVVVVVVVMVVEVIGGGVDGFCSDVGDWRHLGDGLEWICWWEAVERVW